MGLGLVASLNCYGGQGRELARGGGAGEDQALGDGGPTPLHPSSRQRVPHEETAELPAAAAAGQGKGWERRGGAERLRGRLPSLLHAECAQLWSAAVLAC